MSEVFGPSYYEDDYRQRLWNHEAISRRGYEELSPKARAIIGPPRWRRSLQEAPSREGTRVGPGAGGMDGGGPRAHDHLGVARGRRP
jgi:hypothetical protein